MKNNTLANHNALKKTLALVSIPVVYYFSGVFVTYKILRLAGIAPQISDFSFFHNINQGLGLFTGGFTQGFWLIAVIILVAIPFVFKQLRFYPTLLSVYLLLFLVAYFTSENVARYKMATLQPVQFSFNQPALIPILLQQYNQRNELRLILISSKDYVVIHRTGAHNGRPFESFRIPEFLVGSLSHRTI